MRVPAEPADARLAALIRETRAKHLTAEDVAVVGRLPAARFVVGALRRSAGVDAAFIGNTTFGAGLPAGDVTREQFDACVRFDGTIFATEVDGARLRQLLAAANLDPDSPFDQRSGEFSFAAGLAGIDPAKTYRIATTVGGEEHRALPRRPADRLAGGTGIEVEGAVLPALTGTVSAKEGP